jgi:pullulanase/glycogen debranching enzyme
MLSRKQGKEKVTTMNNKIHELRKILRQRGKITAVQREYARVELRAMKEMYPIIATSDEVRLSRLGTHNSYSADNYIMRSILNNRTYHMDF